MVGQKESTAMLDNTLNDSAKVVARFVDSLCRMRNVKIADYTDRALRRPRKKTLRVLFHESDRPVSHIHLVLNKVSPHVGHEGNERVSCDIDLSDHLCLSVPSHRCAVSLKHV